MKNTTQKDNVLPWKKALAESKKFKLIKVSADTHKLMKIQAAKESTTIMRIVERMYRSYLKVEDKK